MFVTLRPGGQANPAMAVIQAKKKMKEKYQI
jgi:hypothetical protein